MVLMAAIGVAAYTYANKNREGTASSDDSSSDQYLPPANPLDPSVLAGKRPLDLLPLERTLALFEAPNATITFMDGDPAIAIDYLRTRVSEIVDRNPWLGGYLARRGNHVSLFYDENSVDLNPDTFVSFESGVIPLTRETKYEDLGKAFAGHDVVVRCNAKNQPIFRTAVIPDAELPQSRFALVTSMSHIAGDGYTFHRIFKMLATDAVIEKMNPVRKQEFTDAVYDLCGPEEAFYVDKISRSPVWSAFAPKRDDRVIIRAAFFIDEEWIEGQKMAWDKMAKMEEAQRMFGSTSSSSPQAGNLISVNEELEGGGEEENDGDETKPDANANGQASTDNHVRFADSLDANGTQRSGRRAAKASPSDFKVSFASHQSAPHLTTNDIISSWFFKSIDATVGLTPFVMRNRAPTITDEDAGNYAITIPFARRDYGTPMLIQRARQKGRRVHTDKPLPQHSRDNRYGICVDWRNIGLRKGGLRVGPNGECSQVLNLPCYQSRDLKFIPKSFSSIHLFNAGPHGEPACTVIAPEDVMDRIMESGIVKGIINESSTVRGSNDDTFEEAVREAKQGRRVSQYAGLTDQSAARALDCRMLAAIAVEDGEEKYE